MESPPAYDALWEKEGAHSEKSGKYPDHYGSGGHGQGHGYSGSGGQIPSAPPADGAHSNIYPGKCQ